jgi:hypothetical protein
MLTAASDQCFGLSALSRAKTYASGEAGENIMRDANLRIAMSSIMRRRNGLMASSVMGILLILSEVAKPLIFNAMSWSQLGP